MLLLLLLLLLCESRGWRGDVVQGEDAAFVHATGGLGDELLRGWLGLERLLELGLKLRLLLLCLRLELCLRLRLLLLLLLRLLCLGLELALELVLEAWVLRTAWCSH